MAKKKTATNRDHVPSSADACQPPISNTGPTRAEVRGMLHEILDQECCNDEWCAKEQPDLLAAVLERYDPPLSEFCMGMVAGHLEALLDEHSSDPSLGVTARGFVYHRLDDAITSEDALDAEAVVKMLAVLLDGAGCDTDLGNHISKETAMKRELFLERVLSLYGSSLSDTERILLQGRISRLLRRERCFETDNIRWLVWCNTKHLKN